jgi:arginine decarboxylase
LKSFKKFWRLGRKEFNTQYFDLSKDGYLIVYEGNYQYNIHDIVKKFGTPLKIMLPYIIEQRVEDLMDLFDDVIREYKYKGQFYYHYPMKVNQNREFVLPIISEGGNLETTSANDLWVVKRLWEQHRFNSRIKVICNGPKTEPYLALIAELKSNGLDIVPIIEDVSELEALQKFRGQVGVRVDLGVPVESRWDKKIERFGLQLDELWELGKIKNLTLLHYHNGCEIQHERDMLRALRSGMEVYKRLKKLNPSLDTLNVGGGLPANYNGKKKYAVTGVVRSMIRFLEKFCRENEVQPPNIICEWGSYVVAPSQLTVFKILNQKAIPKSVAKQWYVIDGSFQTHLLDTWGIHKQWHVVAVNNAHAQKLTRTWLAGLSCDSDDKYTAGGSYILLPRLEDLENGDKQYIAFLDTGNYQDGFTNHHCLNAAPAKVVCQNGDVTVVRKRETPDEVGKLFGW